MKPTLDDKLDMLYDLKHDLGKYLVMPLAMLPSSATEKEIRKALHKALFETRVTPRGTRSAREIWDAFVAESNDEFSDCAHYEKLRTAVHKAFSWEQSVDQNAPPAKLSDILVDMRKVGGSIFELIEELKSGN